MENLDALVISRREIEYHKSRKHVFNTMITKHINKQCQCIKNGKTCTLVGSIDINRCNGDIEYVHELYDTGLLDGLYNIMQSVTQSLRCSAGKVFESIIEDIFKTYKVNYKSQVKIDGHIVDFVIYDKSNTIYSIVSTKTTLRERYLQDKYIKYNVIYITMDTSSLDNVITINESQRNLTRFIENLPDEVKLFEDKYNVLDLFCGAGGFSKGFKDAGFNIVAGIDIWDNAIETYKLNNDHVAICADLCELSPDKLASTYNITKVDVIIGGPPCQSFSIAGKRDASDTRNTLFEEYVKYVDYFKPKMFIMENVIGILSMKLTDGTKVIDTIIESFNTIGYKLFIYKLYASDFEVPQNRRRVIIFGVPLSTAIEINEPKHILKVSERIPVSAILEDEHTIDDKYFLSERAITGINNKKEKSKAKGHGFGAQFLDMKKPSYTIPARYYKDGYDALVKYTDKRIRKLTPLELKRIQTFPDNYRFVGSTKDVIIQIGNAVPCRFSYHIARHALHYL